MQSDDALTLLRMIEDTKEIFYGLSIDYGFGLSIDIYYIRY